METKSPENPAQDCAEHIELFGHATQHEDHQQTKWQAIKANPRNIFWCLYGAWALICIGFDYDAGTIVLGITQFRKDFGVLQPDGGYVIDAGWQSAFSGGANASYASCPFRVQL